MIPSSLPPAKRASRIASTRIQMPAHHAADLHAGPELRVADPQRAFLHVGRAEPRQQPGRGRDEVAEQRQPARSARTAPSRAPGTRRGISAGPRQRRDPRRGARGAPLAASATRPRRARAEERRRQRAAGPAPGVPARERRSARPRSLAGLGSARGQARGILVGVEIGHVDGATLQTRDAPALCSGGAVELSLNSLRRRRPLYPNLNFVTTL